MCIRQDIFISFSLATCVHSFQKFLKPHSRKQYKVAKKLSFSTLSCQQKMDVRCNHFYPCSVEYTSRLPLKQRPSVSLNFFKKNHKNLSALGFLGNKDIKRVWHGLANGWVQSVYDNWYAFIWFSFEMFFEESHNFESVSASFCMSSCVDLQMLSRESMLFWGFAVDNEDLSAWLILKF